MEDMNAQESGTNGCEVYEQEEVLYLDAPVKQEPMTEEERTSLDLPLDCLLCAKKFCTVSGLKAHVLTEHNYKTVRRKATDSPSPEKRMKFSCSTCGRILPKRELFRWEGSVPDHIVWEDQIFLEYQDFVTSTDLMVHTTCHNKSTCYGCWAEFDSYDGLMKHSKRCKKFSLKSKKQLNVFRSNAKSEPAKNNKKCNQNVEVKTESVMNKDNVEIPKVSESVKEIENDNHRLEIKLEVTNVTPSDGEEEISIDKSIDSEINGNGCENTALRSENSNVLENIGDTIQKDSNLEKKSAQASSQESLIAQKNNEKPSDVLNKESISATDTENGREIFNDNVHNKETTVHMIDANIDKAKIRINQDVTNIDQDRKIFDEMDVDLVDTSAYRTATDAKEVETSVHKSDTNVKQFDTNIIANICQFDITVSQVDKSVVVTESVNQFETNVSKIDTKMDQFGKVVDKIDSDVSQHEKTVDQYIQVKKDVDHVEKNGEKIEPNLRQVETNDIKSEIIDDKDQIDADFNYQDQINSDQLKLIDEEVENNLFKIETDVEHIETSDCQLKKKNDQDETSVIEQAKKTGGLIEITIDQVEVENARSQVRKTLDRLKNNLNQVN